MAVRPQGMHDGSIVERRLRPIYDWLDYGNNKKAVQEADKVLKKTPKLQTARALKALALLRLGRTREAHDILDELAKEKPSDDTTLQAMTISYRESQQIHKVCALYEEAVKVEPTSEELHSHLFMSYVRIGDYRSQQRAAMALYKFAPKNPYYFWAVMSVVLQAKTSEDDTKRGILLTLAQRMVDNFIADNKMEAEQEARLYIMILELQDKYEDILKFIESPLYSQLVQYPTGPTKIKYLKKLGRWRELNLLCKDLLLDNQDRWDYYEPYLNSVFELMKEKPSEESAADDTPEKCHEFICHLLESVTGGRTLRGPYIARLELWKRLLKNKDGSNGDPTELLGNGVALCVQYLKVFAHKPCAVPDLRPYIKVLSQKEREDHCRDFLTCTGFDETSQPENTDDVQRHICCLTLWRLTAPPLDAEGNLSLANTLRDHYLRCLEKGLVISTTTEFCAAEYYAILAGHHYFYAAVEQEKSAPILEALCLLELVLEHSPSNYHIKLLLIVMYHLLGNGLAADTIYQKLEAKHIQLVSLGWLHCARLPPACAPARALHLLTDTKAFHTHHAKDSVEHLTYAYKFGTFEKVMELWGFGRRLEGCAWCCSAGRERAALQMLAGPHQPPQPNTPLPLDPTDNRDLDVIVSYKPPQCEDVDLKTRTYDQDLAYLRLKDGLLSCISLCVELSDQRSVEEKRKQYDELKTCIDAFSGAMDKCKDVYSVKEKISIEAPFPCRIIAFVNSPVPYRELYATTLTAIAELSMNNVTAANDALARVTECVTQSRDELKRDIEVSGDAVWSIRIVLERIANYLEFIGIITFLLGVCHEMVAPANATKKSRRKAAKSPDEIKTQESITALNQTVQESIAFVEELFDNLPKYEINETLEEKLKKLDLKTQYTNPVEEKLQNGQKDMVNDIKNILKNKKEVLRYASQKFGVK